jgi:hypothetical protein
VDLLVLVHKLVLGVVYGRYYLLEMYGRRERAVEIYRNALLFPSR